mmetsp:Transcript_11738/g.17672  ORF Transcript_11738/g.17672 Transcript_11738/m.17672 type:complete len:321 (-) Transcript_11738:46-1008(-)
MFISIIRQSHFFNVRGQIRFLSTKDKDSFSNIFGEDSLGDDSLTDIFGVSEPATKEPQSNAGSKDQDELFASITASLNALAAEEQTDSSSSSSSSMQSSKEDNETKQQDEMVNDAVLFEKDLQRASGFANTAPSDLAQCYDDMYYDAVEGNVTVSDDGDSLMGDSEMMSNQNDEVEKDGDAPKTDLQQLIDHWQQRKYENESYLARTYTARQKRLVHKKKAEPEPVPWYNPSSDKHRGDLVNPDVVQSLRERYPDHPRFEQLEEMTRALAFNPYFTRSEQFKMSDQLAKHLAYDGPGEKEMFPLHEEFDAVHVRSEFDAK